MEATNININNKGNLYASEGSFGGMTPFMFLT